MIASTPEVNHVCFDLRRYPASVQQHAHAHHQIVLPLGGTLMVETGRGAATAGGHTAAVIASGLPHGFAGFDDGMLLVLDIPAGSVAAGASPAIWNAFSESPFVKFDDSLNGLSRFIASHGAQLRHNPLRADVLGNLVVESLGAAMGFDGCTVPARLRKARRFIDAHYLEPITVGDIARAANVSESRLYALFEHWLDVSPTRYVTRCRLRHAAFALRGTPTPIAGIALGVGYADQGAFTRAFQREFGQSPSAYRKLASTRGQPALRESSIAQE